MENNRIAPKFNSLNNPDTFFNHLNELKEQITKEEENKGLFKVMPANKWIEQAKSRPVPKMLFSELWFENELCILFADTNLGKSILAVQIGNSISKGEPIPGFKMEAAKQPVLYFDFELTEKQFENRYSIDFKNHYRFDDELIRIEINPDAEIPENGGFENYLKSSFEQSIIETKAKILIVDNLTYLKNENEKAKDALLLMKYLKELKSKYGLSILALAHTPKRDLTKPITRNDLQGSKMLINFCDSAFAIGESFRDKGLRYIKQIKARNTEVIYNAENVIICQIEKPFNFLQFIFLDFDTEMEHLRHLSEEEKIELENNIIEIKTKNPELSLKQIAEKVGTYKVKVKRVLDDNRNTQ
jgi:RecA-family ATPase